jgi:hypothetical protein
MSRRRLLLIGLAFLLLGMATSPGAAYVVRAYQGGEDPDFTRQQALLLAARSDDQQVWAAASASRLVLAGGDHQGFQVVAAVERNYTDAVGATRSALGLGQNGIWPESLYSCFDSTSEIMRGSALIFSAAAGVANWSRSQAQVVSQTVDDLDLASQYLDRLATGGERLSPKASVRPGPNGVSSSELLCQQISVIASSLQQRTWPA